jgi:hypothetical protein
MKRGAEPTTLDDFWRLWAAECEEWMQIRADLLVRAEPDAIVSAHDVSQEQRRRMLARGEVSAIESAFARVVMGAPGVSNDMGA